MPLVVETHSVQSQQEATAEEQKYAWEKKVNRWNIGLTLAIALCALAQVFVYLLQTRLLGQTLGEVHSQAEQMKTQVELMRKQTGILGDSVEAAKESAKAALAQVEIAKLAERAWVVEKINFPDRLPRRGVTGGGVLVAVVVIKNIGRQPATLKFCQTRFHTPDRLSPKPEYCTLASIPDGFLLAPGDEKILRCTLEEVSLDDNQVSNIETGSRNLYLYGYIAYESIGIRGLNQFCYKWNPLRGVTLEGDKSGFEKNGPDGYNKHA